MGISTGSLLLAYYSSLCGFTVLSVSLGRGLQQGTATHGGPWLPMWQQALASVL